MDPVHASLRWQYVARIEQGPIFQRINKLDQVVDKGPDAKQLVSFFETFYASLLTSLLGYVPVDLSEVAIQLDRGVGDAEGSALQGDGSAL